MKHKQQTTHCDDSVTTNSPLRHQWSDGRQCLWRSHFHDQVYWKCSRLNPSIQSLHSACPGWRHIGSKLSRMFQTSLSLARRLLGVPGSFSSPENMYIMPAMNSGSNPEFPPPYTCPAYTQMWLLVTWRSSSSTTLSSLQGLYFGLVQVSHL